MMIELLYIVPVECSSVSYYEANAFIRVDDLAHVVDVSAH